MLRLVTHAVALALGIALGVSGSMAVRPGPRAQEPPRASSRSAQPTPRAAAEPTASARDLRACREDLARLEAKVAEGDLARTLLSGQLAAERGDPQPWPEGLPGVLGPGGFERAVAQFAEEQQLTLDEVQCDEYPCIGVLSFEGMERSEPLQRELTAWGREAGVMGMDTRLVGVNDTTYLTFAAYGVDGPNQEARQRTDWRFEQVQAALMP